MSGDLVASEPADDGFDGADFKAKFEEEAAKLGRVNIAVFGRTGVGKSTLINAVFGKHVAATGIGRPVTTEGHLYVSEVGAVGIYDTVGLEIGRDNSQILKELKKLVVQRRKKPIEEQLHIAWYCVHSMSRRFEPFEAEFIRRLDDLELPVVLVLTQVPKKKRPGAHPEIHPDVPELLTAIEAENLPLAWPEPVLTAAAPDSYREDISHGLTDLVDASFRLAPEAVRDALMAAQILNFEVKRSKSREVIATAAASAAGTAATPIPFSDAALLVPIQTAMMARIANVYGLNLPKASSAALVATGAATSVGRSLVSGAFKLVPGIGTLVGGMISASVATALTTAMGFAWMAVCERISRGELDPQALDDQGAIARIFVDQLKTPRRAK